EESLEVLKSITLELKKGEMVALLGQSGAGKSTLLQICGLLDRPTSGTIELCGKNVSLLNDKERTALRRDFLGFVYQFHYLLPEFSALENVMIPRMIQGESQGKAKEKGAFLLEQMGLSHRLTHRPKKLSGGEQQRVAIARALCNEPKLLLADEPTGNLDPKTASHVFSNLKDLVKQRGLCALIATHNLELAKKMDRVVVLEEGMLKTPLL
ncbi:MAG TPA: ABC transporter ATP-binding protein, partial [Alphaproteobacteria bacterium]|nr:ABC transporter ATP-binding protein [Alphaproteobacteria bacterium]